MTEKSRNSLPVDRASVRRLREAKAWTQADLAKKTGLNLRTIELIETDEQKGCHASTLRMLSDALGVEPRELLLPRGGEAAAAKSTDPDDAEPDQSGALRGHFKVVPLGGQQACEIAGRSGPCFVGGFKFRITLQNKSTETLFFDVFDLVVRHTADVPTPIRFVSPPARTKAAPARVHELLIELCPDSFGGKWVIDRGNNMFDRGINLVTRLLSPSSNLLEADGGPPIVFAMDPGEVEVISGAVAAKQPGLYEVTFRLGYDVSGADYADATPVFGILAL